MADNENALTQTFPQAGLGQNPVVRQLGVMVGIAASVALGIAIVLWSQTPNYSVLFGNLAQKDAAEVVSALEQNGIPYKVNQATGAVMVASGQLHEARMKLAGQGLPQSDSLGFEILQQETGFGTSRALEAARFHRALEGELARTISTLTNIESARVHLATPKKSVFVRKQNNPSASVVLKLYSGRVLDKGQVAAIVHLIASSVPELDASRVTVVDHKGNMLSNEMDSRQMMLTSSQFEYTRELEQYYRERVEDILAPILGVDRVRAQVTADIDFTVTEQTSERFNPDLPALRSEQVNEQSSRLSAVQGVPGALSNQPPAAGTAPEVATQQAEGEASPAPLNSTRRATRNYELDKTISHTRLASNKLRRLSVAVVVDDLVTVADDGSVTRVERTPEEISRITRLVRETIGFNAQRGDSVEVINSAFMMPAPPEPLPEPEIWEEAWVWDVAKQAGGVILVLLLIFFVLRPTMKRLTSPATLATVGAGAEGTAGTAGGTEGSGGGSLDAPDESMMLPGPEKYENTLEAARQMVQDDPKRVAQVVRSWIASDAG
ncbi:MAG: flagellar basal-body MS-ring/collar protein FliF [Sedimenticola sp.]|nr:flagellar basal-body MS-ring/collar protein FliF [Sedimenticola sp.]